MSTDEDYKKIDPRKHKKYSQFLLYSFCHYILEIYNRLADKSEINFAILIPLVNNYILNLFTICIANQVNLDTTKGIIDEAVIIVLDYISISHEDEFQKSNYNPRFNDAIFFSWQKIHDRILAQIPTKTTASVITNLPQGTSLLCTGTHSLPSNISHSLDNKPSSKKKIPIHIGGSSNLLNYISIIGCSNNRTSKSIILTCEIITKIFNLFGVIYPLNLLSSTVQNNWMELFEKLNPDILVNDSQEDDIQYSNSVFFNQLTYNLDILESFINMLLPQLLKISQSIISCHFDLTIGQKIANNINQIYTRLSEYCICIPSFIYLTIIYNYLHTLCGNIMDDNYLISVNNSCSLGLYLGLCLNSTPDIKKESLGDSLLITTTANKYFLAINNLKAVLGQSSPQSCYKSTNSILNTNKKIINNRNLITAIITLNSNIVD